MQRLKTFYKAKANEGVLRSLRKPSRGVTSIHITLLTERITITLMTMMTQEDATRRDLRRAKRGNSHPDKYR